MRDVRLPLLGVVVTAALALAVVFAQNEESFSTRLSVVPIDGAMSATHSGSGYVTAVLTNSTLELHGHFEGLSTPATAAHVHLGDVAVQQGDDPGAIVFELDVTNDTSGEVSANAELSEEDIENLRSHRLYVLIHTEQNPVGEIRGWLMPANE